MNRKRVGSGLGGVRPARFALLFGVCFLAGIAILLTPPVQDADALFSHALVRIAHALITQCGGHALMNGAVLRDPIGGFAVEMRDGCNAVNVTILLWSAIIAFPAPWRLKAAGAAAGGLLLEIVNLGRFVSLFYLGQYSLRWFDFAHGYLWESLLILDTLVIFWLWVTRVSQAQAAAHGR
jgi:exosortase H (IPTLxxWG-CTERM-specific)